MVVPPPDVGPAEYAGDDFLICNPTRLRCDPCLGTTERIQFDHWSRMARLRAKAGEGDAVGRSIHRLGHRWPPRGEPRRTDHQTGTQGVWPCPKYGFRP